MSLYRVIGTRRYLEHPPGATFEASLPPAQVARAVEAGAIQVLKDSPVTLQPGTVRLADGWSTQQED